LQVPFLNDATIFKRRRLSNIKLIYDIITKTSPCQRLPPVFGNVKWKLCTVRSFTIEFL